MKIYITNNLKLCPAGTIAFPPATMYPHEIRVALSRFLDEDDNQPVEGIAETCIATLNRTVLDQVQHEDAKDGARVTYSDVVVETASGLIPLLDLHDADWLAQSKLGTLFEQQSVSWLPHPQPPAPSSPAPPQTRSSLDVWLQVTPLLLEARMLAEDRVVLDAKYRALFNAVQGAWQPDLQAMAERRQALAREAEEVLARLVQALITGGAA